MIVILLLLITESSISKASEKQDSFKRTIVAIVVISCALIFQGVLIAILYRKKKTNVRMPPSCSGMRNSIHEQCYINTNMEMNTHPFSSGIDTDSACKRDNECSNSSNPCAMIMTQANGQYQNRKVTDEGVLELTEMGRMIVNTPYYVLESSENHLQDGLRPSASHTNKDEHCLAPGICQLEDQNEYYKVSKDFPQKQFVENTLYEWSDGSFCDSDPAER